MSIIQDTQFSKKSCDKKKFDIENLNFKNLGIKTKNQSNKGLNPTLQDQTTECIYFFILKLKEQIPLGI